MEDVLNVPLSDSCSFSIKKNLEIGDDTSDAKVYTIIDTTFLKRFLEANMTIITGG